MRIFVASATWLSLACSAEAPRAPVPPVSPAPSALTPVPVLPNSASSTGLLPADTTNAAVVPPADTTQVAAVRPADTTEEAAIRTAEGRVSRVGRVLRVQLIGGRTNIYDWDGQEYKWHRYAGYLKTMRSHVIHMFGMEGSGSHLIVDDSTGDSVRVWGTPIVSPDGTRFVITSMSDFADYDPTLIEIWRVVARKPEKEFSIEPQDYQPSNAVWRDSATIDFVKYTYVGTRDPDDPYIKTPGRLRRTGGKWVLTDP